MELVFGVLIFIIFGILACMSDNNAERNSRLNRIERILDIRAYMAFGTKSKLDDIEERLDNLPQNRAKVALEKLEEVKQIMDELEE